MIMPIVLAFAIGLICGIGFTAYYYTYVKDDKGDGDNE